MEVTDSNESAAGGPGPTVDPPISNGGPNILIDDPLDDDGRSSSLSEIDDVSEHEPSDDESLKQERGPAEIDSEAETERIEDSPHTIRSRRDIVVTAGRFEASPSKLAQSTTYDDIEDEEEHDVEETPSKARRTSKSNGLAEEAEETPAPEDSEKLPSPPDVAGKKRKRLQAADDLDTEPGDEEPLRKRRGSVKSDLGEEVAAESLLSREATEDVTKPTDTSHNGTPADDTQDLDVPAAPTRAKKGKKGKRKGKKVKEVDEETENGGAVDAGTEGAAEDQLHEDEEAGEVAEEGDDVDAAAKSEEELAKKIAAMEALSVLEKEFATLRDKIYDERIAKLDRELEQLTGPEPTHPEYLRQLECVKNYRDQKIKYERTLFRYRLQSLLNRSLAERAQIHSTYFQRIRDARERHSAAVSKQFYAIQHDRFKTEDFSPHHYIPFPTRRSQQIAQQQAYNQEVSVMAGVAKYVGFPAAPTLEGARPSEIEEDMEKMGISMDPRPPLGSGPGIPRSGMSGLSSRTTTAEEAFLERNPWANPQYALHHQQTHQQPSVTSNPTFATPAAQKRVVDINAPNGSASTIAENSSAANTPYGTEQDPRSHGTGQFSSVDYDTIDRKTGFRSQSSSPLDVRKPQPASGHFLDSSRQMPSGQDASRNTVYSPPSRLGLFGASKRESSPPMPKSLNTMHPSQGIATSAGSSRMVAR
ncbi:hypothetical protein VTN77DRAFT_3409 [Rasamsonia byssochlamydoides]|uniref:uncharacterized protein n=1 Tax=Rasamsonia byssochlamydoides TaxID=89139 RepID=UPI0037444408